MDWQTDWLGSDSIFYHELTGSVSRNILEVIDWANFDWDADGLANYVDFGYCVFSHTPIRHVRFLPAEAKLVRDPGQRWQVQLLRPDSWFADQMATETKSEQVVSLIQAHIRTWEAEQQGATIVLPLSGGFDSRMILSCLAHPQNVRAFTYGQTKDPAQSMEVVHAHYLAQLLGLHWQTVELGRFMAYQPEWYALFGCSTHAHGMYQMEFFDRIRQLVGGHAMGSGLLGDNLAGKMVIPPIHSPSDLIHLGYHHGLQGDATRLKTGKHINRVNEAMYEQKRDWLADPKLRVLEAVRAKMMLLKYLLQVPTHYGFRPYAPFAHEEVGLAMMALPDRERKNRQWQRDYFAKINWYPEQLPLKGTEINYLNQYALLQNPVPPLSEKILGELFDPAYINWINRHLLTTWRSQFDFWFYRNFRATRLIWRLTSQANEVALGAYQTLYPLQRLIEAREAAIQ